MQIKSISIDFWDAFHYLKQKTDPIICNKFVSSKFRTFLQSLRMGSLCQINTYWYPLHCMARKNKFIVAIFLTFINHKCFLYLIICVGIFYWNNFRNNRFLQLLQSFLPPDLRKFFAFILTLSIYGWATLISLFSRFLSKSLQLLKNWIQSFFSFKAHRLRWNQNENASNCTMSASYWEETWDVCTGLFLFLFQTNSTARQC